MLFACAEEHQNYIKYKARVPGRVRIKPGCLGRFMWGCGGVCRIIVKMRVMTSLAPPVGNPPL